MNRFYVNIFHGHSRGFNNEQNSYLKMSLNRPICWIKSLDSNVKHHFVFRRCTDRTCGGLFIAMKALFCCWNWCLSVMLNSPHVFYWYYIDWLLSLLLLISYLALTSGYHLVIVDWWSFVWNSLLFLLNQPTPRTTRTWVPFFGEFHPSSFLTRDNFGAPRNLLGAVSGNVFSGLSYKLFFIIQ
jgi:hypothetical protein